MKIKIKLTLKKIFRVIYVVLILINIVAIFTLYNFLDKYAYQAFVVNENYLRTQSNTLTYDIDLNKFNKIIEKLNKKSTKNDVSGIVNAFK